MTLALLIVGAYLVGSIPFGVLFGKLKGVDVMAAGSGSTGATNVARLLGWKLGIVVFILDVLKGAGPALVAKLVMRSEGMSVTGSEGMAVYVGVVAVLGHMLSPFLKFKGGKGVATGLGVMFGSAPIIGAIGFGTFLVVFAATRIVSLSALLGSAAVLVAGIFYANSLAFWMVFGPLVVYIFYRHRANIGRLLRGEEAKLKFKKKEGHSDDG